MKQPTLASFNFKKSSNDQDGPHRVHKKKISMHVRRLFPTSVGPPKNKVFPSSWLSQFDLHGFDEKQESMHLMFHCNETID